MLTAPADGEEWRSAYHPGKCFYRRGPGFLEVRDRRSGELSRFVIDDPTYVAAVEALGPGAPAASVPPDIVEAEQLIARVGHLLLWLPYRIKRWLLPSLIV